MTDLSQQPLDQPPAPPAFIPFETPAPPGLHHRTYHPHQRHHGTALHARHTGAVHDPHAQSLGGHHSLAHPHQAAAAAHASAGVVQHTNKHLSRTHQHLSARFGVQKVEVGIITSVDLVGNTCTLRLYGSQTNTIGPVPLGLGLAGSAAVGVTAMVILLDEANPSDAAVVALYGGQLAPIAQRGNATVVLASYQQAGAITFPSPFANAIDAVVATSRDPNYVASVSGESLTGFVLTVTRREGNGQVQGGAQVISVANGASSAGSSVTFGTAFASLTSVAAVCNVANWLAYVTGLSASGFTANVQGVNGAVGPVTVSVEYVAVGVPSVSASVPVDWVAYGR